jgi:hypothetical protein
MRTFALAILLLAAASIARRAAAEDDAVQKLAACEGDPLRLARAVHTLGDAKLLALLADARVEVQLSAVYAAPALLEPEAALEPIAALVASRDSELAPAAARAALTIAQAITADSLAEHEAAPAALAKARALLQQAAQLTRVRADLRQLAAAAAAQLQAIGVP